MQIVHASNCKAPSAGAEFANDQISRAHRLKNALVEQERARRDACNEALRTYHPEIERLTKQVEGLDDQIDEIQEAIKRTNAKTRSRSATKEQREQVNDLKEQRKAARAELKAAKEVAWEQPADVAELREKLYGKPGDKDDTGEYGKLPAGKRSRNKPDHVIRLEAELDQAEAAAADADPYLRKIAEIEKWHKAACKQLEQESGVGWGTRAVVRESVKRSGPPPQFKRWNGDGTIAVQIQGGMTFGEALSGNDSRLTIDPLPDNPWSGSRSKAKTTAHLTVGIDRNHEPVTISVRINITRPIPDDAQIKWVKLVRKRTAQKDQWSFHLTLERESWEKGDAAKSGRVGVDIGWRLVKDGLRVAYWVGDDGQEGSLVIPRRELHRYGIPSEIRQDRDERFDAMRDFTAEWIDSQSDLPDEVIEAAAHIRQWKAHGKLGRLAGVVAEHLPDSEIAEQLRRWDWADRKLWNDEAHTRKKWDRRRRHLYRNFAAELRRSYRTVVLEKVRWKDMARRLEAEEESRDGALTHHMRVCSPYHLQQTIAQSVPIAEWVPAKDTTRTCAVCGDYTGESDPASLYHTCQSCGQTQDQDRIAAVNLLMGGAQGAVPEKSS